MNVNVNLMLENITQVKSGKMINANVSAKIPENIETVKNVISGTLEHILMKMVIIE